MARPTARCEELNLDDVGSARAEPTSAGFVFFRVVLSAVERPQEERPAALPATGLTSAGLLPLSVLLIASGTTMQWWRRRRETAAR